MPHYRNKGGWFLDPLAGSSATGIAACLVGRRYLGIEKEKEYAEISVNRRKELETMDNYVEYRNKVQDIVKYTDFEPANIACEDIEVYDLPF